MAEGADPAGERRPAVRGEAGLIVELSTAPPLGSTVVDLDERGPVAAKNSPGPSWADDAHRPHVHPDYSRRGDRWVLGALKHRTGGVFPQAADRRGAAAWPRFFDGLEAVVVRCTPQLRVEEKRRGCARWR